MDLMDEEKIPEDICAEYKKIMLRTGMRYSMNISIKRITLQNFKGARERTVTLFPITLIEGMNASGKTTIVDAVLWVLFNKDSEGNSSFGIRPVDGDGKEIDNIDISAEVVLEVDGREIVLKKTQKQKWTKHRGSTAPTFEGNVNSYEVDGFPQSEKEFKAKIAEIIAEDDFKLISDLRYFSSLEWKKKKEILLRLIGDVTDEDVINSDPEHWLPIKDDVLYAGVDKSAEKAKKSLRELNKAQKELPVRIDEVRRQIADVPNTSDEEAKLTGLELDLGDIEEAIMKEKENASAELIQKEILDLKNRLRSIESKILSEFEEKRNALWNQVVKTQRDLQDARNKENDATIGMELVEKKIKFLQNDLGEAGAGYHTAKAMSFDESSAICRSCGQMLPKGKIDSLKRDLEERKAKDMERYKQEGWKIRKDLDAALATLEKTKKDREDAIANTTAAKELSDIARRDYDALQKPDAKQNAEYKAVAEQLRGAVIRAETAKDTTKLEELEEKRRAVKEGMVSLQNAIMTAKTVAENNERVRERVAELEAEQRENGAKIALCEQKVMLLEEFSIQKSEMLSRKITQEFEGVSFSLFNQQINGGLVEECEITYNGVKYKDMNSGHRIVCALEIINTFQKKLGISAPVFVDNAETINSFNVPQMNCQLVLLKVSDNKELAVTEC